MMDFKPEGLGRRIDTLCESELAAATCGSGIFESTALAYDNKRRLRFEINGKIVYMPLEECADGANQPDFREIALLTRVGRPTCFLLSYPNGAEEEPFISRRAAQQECKAQYLDLLGPGDTLCCKVTHIEPFGAFCDVGCGISALLPIDCLSVSRIQSPADRIKVGQQLLCAIKYRDGMGRLVLTLKELMGTWNENAACFHPGETVVGIVRSVEAYGVFIEIAPNLAGLAECEEELRPGQPVSVYIKSILPDKMKIKLAVVNSRLDESVFFGPRYFTKPRHISIWTYSPIGCKKHVETRFDSPSLPL